ncbi:MAG: bifunctional riboflavin kinase/FAD synthetase [Candidatus Cyclonatronum sp.]|uniref:bifunctional riboflavin kinase/FAD synthetase n=1 Tax=Cyclonatronum sp. TaxID=3024185 RepID=UPI0025BAC272|nr:bifunctional riboflavin kinase/FAD synthetase [Cyclonatronum sp.]MCC5933063.1 bifunctional riboflavin kinase/FAD synthetase [Balneolales bacterium]MCH8485736.1 bifunctional riboflavin kinase/FAD synthetase [Cyclonatronum sp.]
MTSLTYLNDATHHPQTAITVGTFDGVHLGHRTLIEKLVTKAREINGRSVLVTFNPHPREVLHGGHNTVGLLTTLEERAEILQQLGVDAMVVIPFDRDFSLLSSQDFIQKILFSKIGIAEFIIGYDHQFGKNREGTIQTVKELSGTLGYNVHLIQAHEVAHHTVSSTLIRKALVEKGDVRLARTMLGRPYPLSGMVVHGDKKGRILGFPTANLKIEETRKVIPQKGVYAVEVLLDDQVYKGMLNIGVRPTVTSSAELRIEVNIFGFTSDIYGRQLRVRFYDKIREEKKFEGLDALRAQLHQDKADCIQLFKALY